METFSALLAICEGNPLFTGGLPHKGQVVLSFGVFFGDRLKSEQTVEQMIKLPAIWEAMTVIGRHRNPNLIVNLYVMVTPVNLLHRLFLETRSH